MSQEQTNLRNPWSKAVGFFGLLSPVIVFYFLCLSTFAIFRAALCFTFFEQIGDIENYALVFPVGMRMDTIVLCFSIGLPAFLLILLPGKITRNLRWIFSSYFAFFFSLFVFLEIATFPFMAEFFTRLDRLILEHIVQASEVFTMVLQGYTLIVIGGIAFTLTIGWLVFRLFQKLFERYGNYSVLQRALSLLFIIPLLTIGIRSSFGHRPANLSDAAFSRSHLANQLSLNSTYTLAYAYYTRNKMENDPGKFYGRMDPREMLSRVRKSSGIAEKDCTDLSIPLLHHQHSRYPRLRPLNLVIIIEESLGAEYVGCLGGLPLTPNLDELSKGGVLFMNLYSTGTRTATGIEAVISGFLPTPGRSTVKLGLSQKDFFTIAELLRRNGYRTEFVYGGESRFDNMRGFFLGNGFQKVYDQDNYDNPVFRGTWGVSDEDLFEKANIIFRGHGDKPFFGLILSSSNHDPFEFPDGRITLYGPPKNTRYNAMKYADYALGTFFKSAKKEAYYKNTLFLVIADHSTRLNGLDLIPIKKFHIPGLIIGPGVRSEKYYKLTSQIDMPPTLLDLMGLSTKHPLIGRPLLNLPGNVPGRAVMQYSSTNAFMVENQMIVQRPDLPPIQYTHENGNVTETKLNPERYRDALAHALLPWYLYKNRLHHLPREN